MHQCKNVSANSKLTFFESFSFVQLHLCHFAIPHSSPGGELHDASEPVAAGVAPAAFEVVAFVDAPDADVADAAGGAAAAVVVDAEDAAFDAEADVAFGEEADDVAAAAAAAAGVVASGEGAAEAEEVAAVHLEGAEGVLPENADNELAFVVHY